MSAGELIFIIGGARSGKSRFALELARQREAAASKRVCFIATAEALDEEMSERIARHRNERSADWFTIEEPRQLDLALRKAAGADVVIIDCLTLFVSNWLMETNASEAEEQALGVIDRFLEIAFTQPQTVIGVSNEAGLGIVPDHPLGRSFRDLLGKVNQQIAAAATSVYLMVAGLPVRIKPVAAEWSER